MAKRTTPARQYMFATLSKLMTVHIIVIMPHRNTECERVSSVVHLTLHEHCSELAKETFAVFVSVNMNDAQSHSFEQSQEVLRKAKTTTVCTDVQH